jgi:TrpR family trp operon transcriptional repressor
MEELVEALLSAKNKEEMENLVFGLFSPNEQVEFSTRVKIVKMLKKGIPQHTIARDLGVGVATVSRGAKDLKLGKMRVIKS